MFQGLSTPYFINIHRTKQLAERQYHTGTNGARS